MMTDEFINHKPFSRLRWNIFGNLDDVLVEENPGDKETKLSAFKGHSIAAEPATCIDVPSIQVRVDVWEGICINDQHEEGERYEPPTPLLIEKKDGSRITIREFVEKTHKYLNAHREEVLWGLQESLGDTHNVEDGSLIWSFDNCTQFYFNYFGFEDKWEKEGHVVHIFIYAAGEDGRTMEQF